MSDRACVICGGSLAAVHPNCVTCSPECLGERKRQQWTQYRQRVRSRAPGPAAEKFCPRCRLTLPGSAFARNVWQASGLVTYCKACCRAYAQLPGPKERERLKKHIYYMLWCEEMNAKARARYLLDLEFRARVNARNHARYHDDPKGVYRRHVERQALQAEWEARDERRCFCGKALPRGTGRWFCRSACKVACARFVCGLEQTP